MSTARDWWAAVTSTVTDISTAAGEVWEDVSKVLAPPKEGEGGGRSDADVRVR